MSRSLCLLTSRLLRWTESFDVHLDARYLPGESNVLADVLSRRGQVVGTEWSLHPQVARALLRAWGNPSIDLFATCLNAKLPVLLACPGSPGHLRGCVSPSLERPGSVRVPSLCSGQSGDRLRPRVVACRDDSGRTSLAREGVVRRLAASTDPTTPGSALLGQTASATPVRSVPSRRPRAEPSRVATLKRHYRKSGFSGRAARVLSGVLRESSSRLYQSRWKIFYGWCLGRSVAPVNASVPVVVDFLIHLRQDKGLSVSAVKGYCSALNSVLALKGRDLAASREITTLLRSFARSVNPVELRPPAWDVSLVLQSLCGRVRSVFWPRKRSSYWPLPLLSVSVSSTLCRIESLIPGTGVRFPLLLSLVLWPRLRIPLPLLLGLKALQYRPYQTRERIAMGDYCVLCGQSRFTSTALLHIVRDVNGCLSPQGVARRRLRRPRSPSGSGRRYHALTSSLERHCQCLPLELVRRVVSLRQFFSERILLSTRC